MLHYNSQARCWTLRINKSYFVLEKIFDKDKNWAFPDAKKFLDARLYGKRDGLIKFGRYRLSWSL